MLKRMHLPKTMHSLCSTQRLLLLSPLLFLKKSSPDSAPFSKRPKFQKENFFEERMYFIGENPYDKPQMRHLKFWTRTQMNYYASVLCGRNKIFQHRHIPHVELEAIPCLELVLSVLHDADINTWVFDWMSQNTHYKAPATELLRELPVPIPSDEVVKLYGERELPNGMMEVLMKPLAEGKSSRTTFLVHELKYTSRYMPRGYVADKNMCPFDHKIYAPWIMRFIRTRTGINFHADCQNHVGYMPPIRVNKKTFEPIEGKGKSVIEEGSRPLDGQPESRAYSSWDDRDSSKKPCSPRVLNTRELLLSLHQKVDRNHKWVKHQFGSIVKTLTETQNSVKINHHYPHQVFDRTWATLAHLKTQTELEETDFERDFDWSWPPKKKFRPIPVPDLEDSSFSSFRTAESDEEQLDTATGPRKKTTPKKHHDSSSTAKK
ncbi:hypothetical protein ZWY2020_041055 [Hordeum vulgare]|nr:hypothetical protein ZWY2020_041055 [Hordeum vulgare]